MPSTLLSISLLSLLADGVSLLSSTSARVSSGRRGGRGVGMMFCHPVVDIEEEARLRSCSCSTLPLHACTGRTSSPSFSCLVNERENLLSNDLSEIMDALSAKKKKGNEEEVNRMRKMGKWKIFRNVPSKVP